MANISRIKLDETTYEIKDAQAARASDLALKQDALTAGNGIAIDSSDIIRTTGIPFGVVDETSTSTAYTVTVPGIYKLEEGVCCLVKNGKVTSESGFTLNVNGLGAKPSYSNMATGNIHTPTAATRDTTIFNINYTMLFIYTTSLPDVPNGAWICYRGYDANTNTIGYQLRHNSSTLPASDKFYRYRLLFTSADGTKYVPANTSTSTNGTASRTVNLRPIDPFGEIVYYSSTSSVNAGANPAATVLWDEYVLSLGYSFNRTGAALVLTYPKPVYIKCAPQTDGSAIINEDTPYVQNLPSTDDGKIYIFLGIAYSATNIELLPTHPIYYHDGTGIRLWIGKKIPTKTSELTNDSNFVSSTSLATVATSGSYNDLTNKPTNVSSFTNDAGYQTKQRELIYMSISNNTITFTDSGSNTLTHTLVKTLLDNPLKDVEIWYDYYIYRFYYDEDGYYFGYNDLEYWYGFMLWWNDDGFFGITHQEAQMMTTSHPANVITSAKISQWDNAGKPFIANLIAHLDENDSLDYYTCSKTYAELCAAIDAGRQVYLHEDDFYAVQLEFSRDGRLEGDSFLEFNSYTRGLDGDTFEVDIYDDNHVDYQSWRYANSSDVVHKIYPISYSLLVTRKNTSQLTAGAWYRITDYTCTTTQTDTQSAGHQFDILVQATSPNTLSEEAKAIRHEGDTYFANANLEDWKIWYCLDNDTTRFVWADTTNGKGVIYRMIDEHNNDCPYDFKNIQFKRYKITATTKTDTWLVGKYMAAKTSMNDHTVDANDFVWCYTFNGYYASWYQEDEESGYIDYYNLGSVAIDMSNFDLSPFYDDNYYFSQRCGDNRMQPAFEDIRHWLNNIVIYGWVSDISTFPNNFKELYGDYIDEGVMSSCYSNTFGNSCYSNTFGNGCYFNTFGNDCFSNTFGNDFFSNTFGNSCRTNTFGNGCYFNTFGNSCYSNTFGNGCYSDTFGNSCYSNTFGNSCNSNMFGNNCRTNTFGYNCSSNTFGNGCYSNTFGNSCYSNTFGDDCNSNTFENNCNFNTFGDDCDSNTFSKPYTQHVIVENGNRKITLTSTQTPTSSNPLRNITIAQGVNNTNTTKTISHNTLNDTFRTTYTTDVNGNTYAIAPAKYDEWDGKMSTDCYRLEVANNNGQLIFYDNSTGNTITESQFVEICNNKTVNVKLKFRDSNNVLWWGEITAPRRDDYWDFKAFGIWGEAYIDLTRDSSSDPVYIDDSGYEYFSDIYQTKLVSGTNIKTINNQSLLGSGNLTASDIGALPASTNIPTVDSSLTGSSQTNPVQGGAIYSALANKANINGSVDVSFDASTLQVCSNDEGVMMNAVYRDDEMHLLFTGSVDGGSLNYTFDGSGSAKTIATTADIASCVPTTRKINNKPLSSDITLTASDVGALPSNTHIPSDLKVGSVAGKLYRNNVAGSGNFTVTGNSGCIPNLTAGTFLVSIYTKSATQSYTFRFNFGSSVTYDLSTTNGEISDIRQITIPSNGTFSGLVLNGSVASGTILYVVMYNYLTPISTVGPAAVTNRYADLDGTPTIPTVNNGTLTIQRNGTTLGTFTANLSSNTTANINVPILTSVTVSGTGAVTQALDSNKFYKFGSLTSLTLTLNTASEGLAIYGGKFTASADNIPITLPSGVSIPNNAVSIESGSTYEFNILDGVCLIVDVTAN